MPDPNNVVIPGLELCLQLIPKNANTSIKRALMDTYAVRGDVNDYFGVQVRKAPDFPFWLATKDQVERLPPEYEVWMVVRHPIERIRSFYNDKILNDRLGSVSKGLGITADTTFKELIEIIDRTPDKEADQHWRSQSYDLAARARLVDFHSLGWWWKHTMQFRGAKYGRAVSNLPWLNSTPTRKVEYILRHRYAADYALLGAKI